MRGGSGPPCFSFISDTTTWYVMWHTHLSVIYHTRNSCAASKS